MNHSNLHKFFKYIWDQKIEQSVLIAPMVWGGTGVGKTQSVYSFTETIDANLVCLHLASQEPGDLIGLPARDDENGVTKWYRPEWFPDENSTEKYVIFLDEFNRAHKSVLDVMLPFLLEGTIHGHKLPKNAIIIAASNPDDGEDYSVTTIDDKALLSRLCHVVLHSNFVEWKKFCGNDVHPAVISMAKKEGFSNKVALPEGLTHDPRSLYLAGRSLNTMSDENYKSFGKEFLIGMVGSIAKSIVNEIENKGLKTFRVTPKDVFTKYDKIKHHIEKATKENMPAVTELVQGCLDELMQGKYLTEKLMGNMKSFMMDMPLESLASFASRMSKLVFNGDESDQKRAQEIAGRFANLGPELLNRVNNIGSTVENSTVEQRE